MPDGYSQYLTHFECDTCKRTFGLDSRTPRCCGFVLARYDLARIPPETWVDQGERSLWRYSTLLPWKQNTIISLGEGWTPLISLSPTAANTASACWVKQEDANPGWSVEARAWAVIAAEPVSGEPRDGRSLDGPAGLYAARSGRGVEWSETWAIEGLKTLAFEIAEQLGWKVPHRIGVPTEFMRRAVEKGWEELRVLGAVQASPQVIGPESTAKSHADCLDQAVGFASETGILWPPESAAMLTLADAGSGVTVLVNPGLGLRGIAEYRHRLTSSATREQDKLGGLITPR